VAQDSNKETYAPCLVYKSITQTQFRNKSKSFSNQTTCLPIGITMSNFKVVNKTLKFSTKGEIQFIDLTDQAQEATKASNIKNGIVHVFAPHATGILIVQENDDTLLQDIKTLLEKLVPRHGNYNHPSNAHAHLRSILLPPDKTLPVVNGQIAFGTWQSLFYIETDVYPRERTVIFQVMGE
jgi:secondary thiamine-phosphate synthase enzyme